MTEERMMEALRRTKDHLVRHLEDLNDEIDQDEGRIKDHMVLDGLKDCAKTLRCIRELMGGDGHEKNDSTVDGSGSPETEPSPAVSALR